MEKSGCNILWSAFRAAVWVEIFFSRMEKVAPLVV